MFTAELLRDLFGPNKVLGNHVVIETSDGDCVVLAHLRRGSVRVRTGEQVAAGVAVAQCGNSGNSSEPHLHLHVMDHPQPLVAAGVPFQFVDAVGAPTPVPANGSVLIGPSRTDGDAPRPASDSRERQRRPSPSELRQVADAPRRADGRSEINAGSRTSYRSQSW
jgi:hypothetical protein